MKIVLATKNKGKLEEMRALLKGLRVELLTLEDFPELTLPPETGSTFQENALIKAQAVSSATGLASLADDSGLSVDSLGGRPGVLSARYSDPGATDSRNNEKLLGGLMTTPTEKRSARFECSLAFVEPGPDNEETCFSGTLEGTIADDPRGTEGFGYDPVFIPSLEEGSTDARATGGKTLAELGAEIKNRISHRAGALEKFRTWLATRPD